MNKPKSVSAAKSGFKVVQPFEAVDIEFWGSKSCTKRTEQRRWGLKIDVSDVALVADEDQSRVKLMDVKSMLWSQSSNKVSNEGNLTMSFVQPFWVEAIASAEYQSIVV